MLNIALHLKLYRFSGIILFFLPFLYFITDIKHRHFKILILLLLTEFSLIFWSFGPIFGNSSNFSKYLMLFEEYMF